MKPEDIHQAAKPGRESHHRPIGAEYASSPVWEQSGPDAIIQYILSLAARKGASDVHIEPIEDAVSVKYRIDGFFFRVDPIPKRFQPSLTQKLFEAFRLDHSKGNRPQTARSTGRLADHDFDLVAQTLPTAHGISATIKLINRATFIKDFTTLGLELEDRVRLLEELRSSFGLVLVTAPVFSGAGVALLVHELPGSSAAGRGLPGISRALAARGSAAGGGGGGLARPQDGGDAPLGRGRAS